MIIQSKHSSIKNRRKVEKKMAKRCNFEKKKEDVLKTIVHNIQKKSGMGMYNTEGKWWEN